MKKLKSFLKNPQTIVGFAILTVMVLLAVFAPVICPGNPLFSVGKPLQAPNQEFFMGTDYLGRDVWAMLVWGSRISILFAFGASLLSLIVGIVLAWFGRSLFQVAVLSCAVVFVLELFL